LSNRPGAATRWRGASKPAGEDPRDHIPQWKIAVAAGVVAVVAATVAVVALVRGLVPGDDAEPAPPASALSSPSPAPVTPEPSDGEGEREGENRRERPVVASIRTALDAWEAFARSADLNGVDKAFVVDGPQYRQFEREVRDGKAGVERVPRFSLQSVGAVEQAGRQRKVAAQVALASENGAPDVREWIFVLRRVAGSWRVWTVIDKTGA
jgi:hypothetical protein